MMTDKQIKKIARDDYIDCRQCGHFPDFICNNGCLSKAELKQWADEYEMSVSDFNKYMNYFMELCV